MKCDCGDGCRTCTGEAAWQVRRPDGQLANLCTRCKLTGDELVARLYDRVDVPRLAKLDEGRDTPESAPFGALLDMLGGAEVLLLSGMDLPKAGGRA